MTELSFLVTIIFSIKDKKNVNGFMKQWNMIMSFFPKKKHSDKVQILKIVDLRYVKVFKLCVLWHLPKVKGA